MIGQTILERFTVESLLGEGGMGIVYLAHDETGTRYAIKRLHAEVAADEGLVARFQREAAAHAMLMHPNIAQLHAVGATDDGGLCFVLEYVDGRELGHEIHQGALPRQRALTIARKVLSALHHAHQFGIVHRDLKPENILVGPEADPTVKTIDFGLVKMLNDVLGHEECQRLTTTGMVFGTPDYMAPEQIQSQAVDARTDLYAIGVVLFEMLTGRRPYEHEEVSDLWRAHLHDPIPHLPAALGDHLDAVVTTLLGKRPEERFQSALAASRALATAAA